MEKMHVDAYRFSVAWSRIFPGTFCFYHEVLYVIWYFLIIDNQKVMLTFYCRCFFSRLKTFSLEDVLIPIHSNFTLSTEFKQFFPFLKRIYCRNDMAQLLITS